MGERMFGVNEVITVDQAFNRFVSSGFVDRFAWHEIMNISEGKGDPAVIKLYPGWNDENFKDLGTRLTLAIQKGKLTLR